jgi:hypothetical protein
LKHPVLAERLLETLDRHRGVGHLLRGLRFAGVFDLAAAVFGLAAASLDFGVASRLRGAASVTGSGLAAAGAEVDSAAASASATPIVLDSTRWQLSQEVTVRTSAPSCRSSRRRFLVLSQKEQKPVSTVTLIWPGRLFT